MRTRLATLALALAIGIPAALGVSLANPAPVAAGTTSCTTTAVIWQESRSMAETHGTVSCPYGYLRAEIFVQWYGRDPGGTTWVPMGANREYIGVFDTPRFQWSNAWYHVYDIPPNASVKALASGYVSVNGSPSGPWISAGSAWTGIVTGY